LKSSSSDCSSHGSLGAPVLPTTKKLGRTSNKAAGKPFVLGLKPKKENSIIEN